MLSFFPRDVLDEIFDLIESVNEGFPTYSFISILALVISELSSGLYETYLYMITVWRYWL